MLAWLSVWDADLHMAQQMPLPLTISCSSKSRLVLPSWFLPFWYRLTRVVRTKSRRAVKPLCMCVSVRACVCATAKLKKKISCFQQIFRTFSCPEKWDAKFRKFQAHTICYTNVQKHFLGWLTEKHSAVLWRCWLGGRKGIRPVKKLSGGMLAWLSGMRCRLAYSPVDATATHYLLLQ